VPAQHNSRQRPAGTWEWKLLSLTKEVYGAFLFDKVVPSVYYSHGRRTTGAFGFSRTTLPLERKEELQNTHGSGLEWEFELYCQPPNSPDMNMNDLCFFASPHLLQYHNPTNAIHEIMEELQLIYDEYPGAKLNNSFLTLQTCMNQVIECHGGIDYKIERMNKARLERLGLLPQSIWVTDAAMDWDGNDDRSENSDDDKESVV
jgi:hypothetical protein